MATLQPVSDPDDERMRKMFASAAVTGCRSFEVFTLFA